jgi:hypothetical protein
MTKKIILPPEHWKLRTSAGTFTRRHGDLEKVDNCIAFYHSTVDLQSEDGAVLELIKAFDKYKGSHRAWETDPRNKTHGELKKLDEFLEEWKEKHKKQLSEACIPSEDMVIWRKGVCYSLSKFEVEGYYELTWTNIKNTAVSGYNGSSAVNKVVDAAAGKHVALDGGLTSSITDSIKEFLKHLAGSDSSGSSADTSNLSNAILSGLPDILKNIGGAIASSPLDALKIVKDIRTAINAALLHHKTADLGAGVHAGSPRDIVESVRSQTLEKMVAAIKSAIKNALKSVANLIPFGAIISAFTAVYEYISALWYHYKEREVIHSILHDARDRYRDKIYNKPAEFNAWFKTVIAKSPLIASYFITLPLTGGYYGFLNLYYDDGTQISRAQLQLNYNNFHELKGAASGYVRTSKIRLKAVEGDKLLQHSLDCVYQQNGMNPTTFQRAKFCLYAYIIVPVRNRFGNATPATA